jgi:hypothetical protein
MRFLLLAAVIHYRHHAQRKVELEWPVEMKDLLIEVCGLPPLHQKKGARMGHPAGSPFFRAAAGYYAARLGSTVLSSAGTARLGALMSDEVVPVVGWAATAYTAYSAVKEAVGYYNENAGVCQ